MADVVAEALASPVAIARLLSLREAILLAESARLSRRSERHDASRLAILRLQVERAVGAALGKTVRRGGRGASGARGGSSAPLPTGIDKQRAARLRSLAAVPEPEFLRYIEQVRATARVPTLHGAVRHADRADGREPETSSPWIERVLHVLGSFDVHVGTRPLRAQRHVRPADESSALLRGSVLVTTSERVLASLTRLARLVDDGLVADAVVVLPRALPTHWLRHIAGFRVLFDAAAARPLLAFAGARANALRLALRPHGVIATIER